MRAVVQRVARARVEVEAQETGAIERGLLVYLGVGAGDAAGELAWMADKVVGLRIFEDEQGKMARDVRDVGGSLLVVSQFTLYGDVRKGRRPSFTDAMEPEGAERLYESFVRAVRERGVPVATGRFRADMKVESVNDGPITMWIESPGEGSKTHKASGSERARTDAGARDLRGPSDVDQGPRNPAARRDDDPEANGPKARRDGTDGPNGQEHAGHQLRHR
jgi:D-tyrosyl-tRNA(Tyr) deacylase